MLCLHHLHLKLLSLLHQRPHKRIEVELVADLTYNLPQEATQGTQVVLLSRQEFLEHGPQQLERNASRFVRGLKVAWTYVIYVSLYDLVIIILKRQNCHWTTHPYDHEWAEPHTLQTQFTPACTIWPSKVCALWEGV